MKDQILIQLFTAIVVLLVARGVYKTSRVLFITIILVGIGICFIERDADFIERLWSKVN